MSQNASLFARMKQAGFRRIDFLILAVMLGYAAFMVSEMSKGLTLEKGILLTILSYYMLRIGYEFTFNRGNIPTMSADTGLIRRMIKILKEDARNTVYEIVDCGSGTGKLTRMVARAIPASHVVGLELSKWPYREACFLKRLFQLHNLDYQQKDIFAYDYTTTNAVIIFLNARVTEAIGKKLYAELRPNALVITNEFELKGSWPAPQVITIYTPFRGTLYVYRR